MEKLLWQNLLKAKWYVAGFGGAFVFQWYVFMKPALLKYEVFGLDGNGGSMLKIVTNLTDEEIARLKFQRRMQWHWRGARRLETAYEPIRD